MKSVKVHNLKAGNSWWTPGANTILLLTSTHTARQGRPESIKSHKRLLEELAEITPEEKRL